MLSTIPKLMILCRCTGRRNLTFSRAAMSEISGGGSPTGVLCEENTGSEDVPTSTGTQMEEDAEKVATEAEERQVAFDDLQTKYMKSLAEMENVRGIARRDVANARTFAIQSFAKSLLDVADNLNRATGSVAKKDLDVADSPLAKLYEGVVLTDQQLQKVFSANGVVQVSCA